jgi:hypothetical protein
MLRCDITHPHNYLQPWRSMVIILGNKHSLALCIEQFIGETAVVSELGRKKDLILRDIDNTLYRIVDRDDESLVTQVDYSDF